jgi:hypothetical protein
MSVNTKQNTHEPKITQKTRVLNIVRRNLGWCVTIWFSYAAVVSGIDNTFILKVALFDEIPAVCVIKVSFHRVNCYGMSPSLL